MAHFDDRPFVLLTGQVIGALIEVHRHLGPGLLESAYEACLAVELEERGLSYERQRALRVEYKRKRVECAYRLDFVVGGVVLIELKSVERLLPIHEAQVLTYLKLTQLPVALLVNVNARTIRDGLRRLTSPTPPTPCLPVSL